ncbi:arginyltransferase [Marivibrio halodurans]|uniref:Aspartate/glutamate leucyltransferase n=1 Tax=Marivibrio halodurans TaxID=2039722 RepID=A0A8J7SK16_9PROT|nr:arginyltransferase [Marivibrio halodurans]MBP5855933.1 arginyltransferase [Marivibrio halodurans]
MTVQRSPTMLVFHRSGAMHCPYLSGRVEQQLFAELSGPDAQEQFEHLSRHGFRRSHHIVYRPACRGCEQCIPVRIRVADFKWTRSFRRIAARNRDLTVRDIGASATEEQYALFARYVGTRHGDGDMADMSFRDYANLVVASPIDTTLLEWRDSSGRLRAGCIADRLGDGYSAVYSFFDPAADRRSLGSQVILSLVEMALERGMPHVYLGFWVPGSPKMAYKARFQPLECFGPDGWRVQDGPDV